MTYRYRLSVAVLAPALIALAAPAAAMSERDTGAMVDYAMVFPVEGNPWFYDSFGEVRPDARTHMGIDLFADKGTDVKAAAGGVILRINGSTDSLDPERCCSIVVLHDDGWQSIYAHLNNDTPGTDDGVGWGIAPGLAPGRRVEAGQVIGWVGDSGNAEDTPPHLHFELHDPSGIIVNPYQALRPAAEATDLPSGSGGSGDPTLPLRTGDDGIPVQRLQEDLQQVGVEVGEIDGAFGPVTAGAVTEFQKRHRLEADGLVGEVTRAALAGLIHAGASGLIGFGTRGDEVAEMQRMLASAGVDPGPIDGDFGPSTLNAVLAFQRAQALAVDGLIGPATRSALTGNR